DRSAVYRRRACVLWTAAQAGTLNVIGLRRAGKAKRARHPLQRLATGTRFALCPPYELSPRLIAAAEHMVEHRLRRPAVEREAVLLLVRAERRARQHAGLAVDLVLIEPA